MTYFSKSKHNESLLSYFDSNVINKVCIKSTDI